VKLEVWRDKQTLVLDAQLAEWEAPGKDGQIPTGQTSNKVLGMSFRALTPDMVESLGLTAGTTGVVLLQIEPDSPAEKAGLIQGDVILEVAREAVTDANSFRDLVAKHGQPGTSFLVRYVRGSGSPDISIIEVPKDGAK
jgi:serine protease Do